MRSTSKIAAISAIVLGAVSIATPSVGAPTDQPRSAATAASTSTNADDLFSGIFFHSGPIGDEIAAAAGLPATSPNVSQLEAQRQLIVDVELAHPGAIDALHAAVATGDLARSRAAIVDTAALVAEVIEPQGAASDASGTCLILPVVAAVVLSVWVYVNLDQDEPDYPNYQMARVSPNSAITIDRVSFAATELIAR